MVECFAHVQPFIKLKTGPCQLEFCVLNEPQFVSDNYEIEIVLLRFLLASSGESRSAQFNMVGFWLHQGILKGEVSMYR